MVFVEGINGNIKGTVFLKISWAVLTREGRSFERRDYYYSGYGFCACLSRVAARHVICSRALVTSCCLLGTSCSLLNLLLTYICSPNYLNIESNLASFISYRSALRYSHW